MQLSSHKTDSDRGGKGHIGSCDQSNVSPTTVVGSPHGVCIMIDRDDGRTYRIVLHARDLRRICDEARKVTAA